MNSSPRRRRRGSDDMAPQSLTRKQVIDMLRKGRPLVSKDLRGQDLSGLCFDGVDLTNAKLADANLSRCTFRDATLQGASMWNATLKNVVFDRCILDYADLDCTTVDGCTFLDARIKKTIFPDALNSLRLVQESVRTGRRVHLESVDHD